MKDAVAAVVVVIHVDGFRQGAPVKEATEDALVDALAGAFWGAPEDFFIVLLISGRTGKLLDYEQWDPDDVEEPNHSDDYVARFLDALEEERG